MPSRLRFNSSKPRFDRHRIGGQDAPDIVYENPQLFDSMSFKVRFSALRDLPYLIDLKPAGED